MTVVTIYRRQGFELVSHGNGWAYQLMDLRNGPSFWCQDGDALQFRAEFDAAFEIGDSAVSNLFSDYLATAESES